MKKIFFSFLILAFIGFVNPVSAQQQCSQITSSNYSVCCSGRDAAINQDACIEYDLNQQQNSGSGGGVGNTGVLIGGTPNTNPTNSGGNPSVITPTPQASSAALSSCSAIKFNSLLDILIWLKCVIGAAIIPLIFTLAFLYFLWGMVMFIKGADDVKKREESKKFIYWGIIGLTVMIAVWGIVQIVTSTFGLGNAVPRLQTDCLTTDKNNPCK
jgi:hypothetical protein